MHFTGIFALPVSTLREPSPTLQVRDVKDWYVDYLVELMSTNDQEDLTAPLLVIASVCKTYFKVDNLCTYTYEV